MVQMMNSAFVPDSSVYDWTVWGESEHFPEQQLVMQIHPWGGQSYFLEIHTMLDW